MATVSDTAHPSPGRTTLAPDAAMTSRLAPRSVPAGRPELTKRELADLEQLQESFREIYTAALSESGDAQPVTIGVTSAIRGEGRTTTALGLALTIARDLDVHVLLVELDLERPALARELQIPATPGLVDVLVDGDTFIGAAVRHLENGGIDLLPVGSQPRAPSRLLRSATLRSLLEAMRDSYQVVILDLPPTLGNSDIVPLSSLTDGLLLVVRAGVTPARLVERATTRFPDDKVRGVILTGQYSKIPRWMRRLF